MIIQALRPNNARRQTATGGSFPAPVGGWDAQSPLAAMPAKNAVTLDNWITRQGYVEMRQGFVSTASSPDDVETLMTWRGGGPGSDILLACAGAHIYDTLNGSTDLYADAINARWQSVNFANDAGQFVIAVNGANIPQKFDGSSFADLTITGTSGPITLDPTTLIDVMSHSNRLYFFEKDSLRVWFLDPEAIQGAAQLLDLGTLFQLGGQLAAMSTWSLDGGQGPAEMAVFITTEGEVGVYQGTDPSDITNWAEIGRYAVGLPLGHRALMKYGADLALVTTDGIIPLSQAIKLDRAQENQVALTAKIQNAFQLAVAAFGTNFGWQGIFYPAKSIAIFNVPTVLEGGAVQFVQSMQGGGWSRFTGLNAICWGIANDLIYFGGDVGVYQWDTGASDGGSPIVADLLTAYNYFGYQGVNKKFEMIRPLLNISESVQPVVDIVTDFRTDTPVASPTPPPNPGAIWDLSLWDVGLWSPDTVNRYNWTSVQGIGFCAAVRMRVSVNQESPVVVQAIAFDTLYQRGAIL